ncbi:MAG: ribosome maturation factor RimP [Lachnospiraceae bacterium]|nr:ribosome maturation factor RimP [Lachnospiraceae bacterium]
MPKREVIEQRTEALLAPILEETGYDLWDVQYVSENKEYFLRVYIDKEGGITIDDCVDVSRKLSDALDSDEFIDDAYTLEVSSPGLGRRLVKDREFDRSIGRDVDVRFYKSIDGTKELTGKLISYDKDTVTIETDDGDLHSLNRSDIATVKLSVDF